MSTNLDFRNSVQENILRGMSQDELVAFALNLNKKKDEWERSKSCNLNQGNDLSNVTNAELAQKIIARMPKNSYESVKVTNVERKFYNNENALPARKIELMKEKWNLIGDAPKAFLHSLFKSNSVYVRILNETGIKTYLLDSTDLDKMDRDLIIGFKKDIHAAYVQYKTIRIFVDEQGKETEIEIESESKLIKGSIDSGKFIRDLFSKDN